MLTYLLISIKDLKNNPTVMKLEGLAIVAEVTDHIEYSEADELKYKQYLLETIESKREAKVSYKFYKDTIINYYFRLWRRRQVPRMTTHIAMHTLIEYCGIFKLKFRALLSMSMTQN